MKGRQVAERGQQNLGQPVAQAREDLWPQTGVWTGAEHTEGGKERGMMKSGKKGRDRDEGVDGDTCREMDTETNMEIQSDKDTEKAIGRQKTED